MAYQVLALKYRPLLFEDLIGQDHISQVLTKAVETGRIANGYLFTGPRGTGKTTTARILAKALNCVEGPTATPCNKCPICNEITAGSSLDVLEIDAASNTGVDDIRTLRENIRYLPTSGKKRVFIIDEVHRLSGSAFDALLKTLEEPPEHALFIFATTEPHKVPQTILSRTQRYDFRRVTSAMLADHLKNLAEKEKVEIDQEALFLIARKGEGSVRDALSLMDQMMAVADGKITLELTARTLGVVDRKIFEKLLEIIAAGKTEPVFDLVKILFESGIDAADFVNDFISYLRNLLIQKSTSNPDSLLDISESEKEALVRQSAFFTEADILRQIQILADLLGKLKQGYDERIFLEIALVRLARMESSITLQEVIERLNRLSGGAGANAATNPSGNMFDNPPRSPAPAPARTAAPTSARQAPPLSSPPPTQPNIPSPPPQTSPPPTEDQTGKPLNLPRVQMGWSGFLDLLKKRKQMLASMLSEGKVSSVDDNKITVSFGPANITNKQVAQKPEAVAVIEEILREHFKITARIAFQIDKSVKPPPVAAEAAPGLDLVNTEDLFASDPELKKMVDRIDGEIIGKKKIEEE